MVDGYGKVSLDGLLFAVPGGAPRQPVDLKLVPDMDRRLVEIRFWQQDTFLGNQHVPMRDLKIVSF
jgi:hypothetical protein